MSRTFLVTSPEDKTDRLVSELGRLDGVVGLSVQRDASVIPRGDVLTLHVTNEALGGVLDILDRIISEIGSITSSEPSSLVSPPNQDRIDREATRATWPEMAGLLRRESNVSNNYVMAMLFSGIVAAVGLWTDTVHLVIGAMVIAPGFEPIIRVPFGLIGRQKSAWSQGLTSSAVGYAAMLVGAAAAALALMVLAPSPDPLAARYWAGYWSSVSGTSVLTALAAGAAGAAIVAAQRSVLAAGVMIALALIPSASLIGMGLATGELALVLDAVARWAVDAVCVVFAGGLVFMSKRRVRMG